MMKKKPDEFKRPKFIDYVVRGRLTNYFNLKIRCEFFQHLVNSALLLNFLSTAEADL